MLHRICCTCSEEPVRQPSSSSEGEEEPHTSRQAPCKLQNAVPVAKLTQTKKQKPSAIFRKKMKHAGDLPMPKVTPSISAMTVAVSKCISANFAFHDALLLCCGRCTCGLVCVERII